MDYSKVNSALSGWVGSGARRDRAKAELGQAMQLNQAQNQMQANEDSANQQMDAWMQHIHQMASQVAVRNEDKEKVQAMYDQEKETFLTELQKSGNDPIKFMNSGGRKVMNNFYNNIALSEDAKRIQENTKQIQSFYEQLENNNGENAHLISRQERREFDAFMNGDIDKFEHKQLIGWGDIDDDADGNTRVDKFLNSGNNFQTMRSNYAIEYGLQPGQSLDISNDDLRNYTAQYIGGLNPQQSLQPFTSDLQPSPISARMNRQFKKLKNVPLNMIGKSSGEHVRALNDFSAGNFLHGVNPENTEIKGSRGFVGDELDMAKAVLGDSVIDLDTYVLDQKAITGQWYTEGGQSINAGEELGDIRPGAIFMGYKIKQDDGSYRLVKEEDLDGKQDAEHALIQEYEADGVLWFDDYFYNEINPSEDTRVMSKFEALKAKESAGAKRFQEGSDFVQPSQEPIKPIGLNSTEEELSVQIPNYQENLEKTMQIMGLGTKAKDKTTSSLMLAFAIGEGNAEKGISVLPQMFNANSSPEVHKALMGNDTNKFYNLYYKSLVEEEGIEAEVASDYLLKIEKLREKIQKAQK